MQDKIPMQELEPKVQGGLTHEGGSVITGFYSNSLLACFVCNIEPSMLAMLSMLSTY